MGEEIANGDDEEVATDESSDSPWKQSSSTSKRSCAVLMILCAAVLVAVLVLLLPNDKKEEKKDSEPFVKSFSPGIPVFGANITQGYKTTEELEQDLASFAFLTLNQEVNGYTTGRSPSNCYGRNYRQPMGGDAGAPDMDGGAGDKGSKEPNFDGVDSFGTNNQEDSIDTADQTKSDGTFVFASYGDSFIVWNATDGEILSKIQLPKPDIPDSHTNGGGGQPEEDNGGGQEEAGSGGGQTEDGRDGVQPEQGIAVDSVYYYNPRPTIEAILLEGDHLALIVSGYGAEYQSQMDASPFLCSYMGTRIIIYNKNGGNPQFVSQKDIHGSYRQAYSTNSNGHVVTQASIDTWSTLREPIQRWKFPDLTDDEYRAEVTKIAQELVPKFVASLTKILEPMDLSRLSLFVDSISSEDTLDGIMSQLKVADSVSMVASFVIDSDDTGASQVLDVSVGGAMQPGYWGYVYANDQMIVLADKGWMWDESIEEYAEMTFFTGFRLDGASSKHEVIGSVLGSPLNPYSIDMVEKDGMVYLRVATTINFWNRVTIMGGDTGTANQVDEESSTQNEIVVLGTESGTGKVLEKQSSVRLGKPDERFTAVRFLDDIAYAVTFLQRDPFYTVDLSDPTNISILGKLDITGFSQYLHPIENGKILAVGQETDARGTTIGMQISLFDVSDPTELTLLDRLVLLNKENGWTSSGASWEPKAFRFFTVEDTGILIIPLNVYSWGWIEDELVEGRPKQERENFEGFVVCTVQDDVITRRFDIDHEKIVGTNNSCASWCGSLPERSFVIDGNLLTLKSQSVVSTDLNTETQDWFIDMRKDICCAM